MSFRHSNKLVQTFKEAIKAEEAVKRVSRATVTGRSEGCSVKYTGLGRVENIVIEESQRFNKHGAMDYTEMAKAVKEAVLDGQMKIVSVKQAEWQGVNPRILTKPALLDFPFALSGAEVTLSSSIEEALENREAVRMSVANTFWSVGRAVDKQVDRLAAKIPE